MADKPESQVFQLPSSYSLVTAQQILLEYFQVRTDHQRLRAQISNPQTFYHALLYLPARYIGLLLREERTRDVFKYGQHKLIHYLFSVESSKKDDEPGFEARNAIEELRVSFIASGKQFTEWGNQKTAYHVASADQLREKARSWERTVLSVIQRLTDLFAQHQIQLSQAGSEILQPWLLDFAASVPMVQSRALGFPYQEETICERCVVALYHQQQLQPLSKALLGKLRPTLQSLDQELLAAFDGVTGINSSTDEQMKRLENELLRMEATISKMSGEIGKKLYDYYQSYASDRHLVAKTSEEAMKMGAEEAIDDFLGASQSIKPS